MATLDLTADVHQIRMPTVAKLPRTSTERFFARFDYRYARLAVLAQETSADVWSISTFPGIATIFVDDLNSADQIFYGGETYDGISGTLAEALADAGYTFQPKAYTGDYRGEY